MAIQLNSLQLATDLAVSKRDQALAELQKMTQAHAFAQSQSDQLQQYAGETSQRFTQGAQKSTTPELLHHHYQFMGRLQQAIDLQQGVLGTSQARVEDAQKAVVQAEVRLASLKQVMAKQMVELTKHKQRMDQKQMDEFAAMQMQRLIRQHSENHHER